MYTWNQLGINEITNLYLYGQTTKPTDLRSETLIRDSKPDPVVMDAVSFMSSGPGRFANARQIRLVQAFMGGGAFVFQYTGERQTFTLAEAVAILGNKTENLSISQSNYQDGTDDLLARAYIYQSSPFTIAKDAVFVIEADGTRHIENFAILPFNDDFDFDSTAITSTVANAILKPKIDPTKIGQKFLINFTQDSKDAVLRGLYSEQSFLADSQRFQQTYKPIEGTSRVGAAVLQDGYVSNLWNAGVTKLLDSEGRLVFHGSNKADNLSVGRLPTLYAPLKAVLDQNGIAYIGGQGNDTISAGATNDYLDGGADNDTLEGGAGNDTYVFKAGDGKDSITDSDGQGSIKLTGATLGGAAKADYKLVGNKGQWSVNGGQTIYTLDEANKRLVISGSALGAGSEITVHNFDIKRSGGYLGVTLEKAAQTALIQGAGSNVFAASGFDLASLAGRSSDVAEGTGKTFTLFLNQAAKAGETITLALSSLGDKFKAILGDSTVDANGAVITLAEGQTQVSFALVQEGDVTQDASMEISASYAGQDASATSNAWSVNLKDAGETAKTFTGDQRAKRIGIEIDLGTLPSIPAYGSYKWSAVTWAEDGTLNGGLEEADFNDVVRGTAANDKIAGLGGADALDGGAGNDQIDGGAGDDLIAGGAGSDDIKGGDGNDVIFSSATLFAPQRFKPSDSWSAPAGYEAFSQGSTWGAYNLHGDKQITVQGVNEVQDDAPDAIDGGDGNDRISAGGGDDRIEGGNGDDFAWGMGGDDVIEGGDGKDNIQGDGIIKAGFLNSTDAGNHGNDFVDGGEGADTIIGGAGDDVIFADTSGASSAAFFVDLAYNGADYVDGEDGKDGNDYIEGGAKDDTDDGLMGFVLLDDSIASKRCKSTLKTLAANLSKWRAAA